MHLCAYIQSMVDDKIRFFKALGDETRLSIVGYLLKEDCCACDFTMISEKDQTTISRHLKILYEAGIVDFRKNGRYVIYSIKNKEMKEMLRKCGVEESDRCCEV